MDAGGADSGPDAMCPDRGARTLIFYGTTTPTHLALSDGQILSVGFFGRCTGTVIADSWMLTAKHCGLSRGERFCVGTDPSRPNRCFDVAEVFHHPSEDTTIARFTRPASEVVPELVPLPIATAPIDSSWVGRTAEAGGYGRTETGGFGTRKFVAVPIAEVNSSYVVINGEGTRGVCGGDSGGPLMIQAEDGTIRVVGELLGGSDSCTGYDAFTRVDTLAAWIEARTGPTIAVGGSCAVGDVVSRCVDGAAIYCDGDTLRREPCAERCGYEPSVDGFRCITGDDPCGGIDSIGFCDGNVARWCQGGVVRQRDCGACNAHDVCANLPELDGAAYCRPDPCFGLTFEGRCEGNTVQWCNDGMFMELDCGAQTCQFVEGMSAYSCE